MPMRFPLSTTERITTIIAIMVILLGAVGILVWKEYQQATTPPARPIDYTKTPPTIAHTDRTSQTVFQTFSSAKTSINGGVISADPKTHQLVVAVVVNNQQQQLQVITTSSTLITSRPVSAQDPYTPLDFSKLTPGTTVTLYGSQPSPTTFDASMVLAIIPVNLQRFGPPPEATPLYSSNSGIVSQ